MTRVIDMIKMICSDLDGTLIPYGAPSVLDEEVFGLIRALAAKGIVFCPASGRQYTSLRKLFAPVAEHCAFLCENGATLFYQEKLIGKTPMPRQLAEDIARDFWQNSDGRGEVMLSGENMAYLMSRGRGMADRIDFIGNRHTFIKDPGEIPEDIVKVSMYVREGIDEFVERFVPKWQAANAAVAGPLWIDTTMANKGLGVQGLCKAFGLEPDEVMAFGDNYNDVAMLDAVGTPYIVDGAAAALRAKYPNHCARPQDVLHAFLAGPAERA